MLKKSNFITCDVDGVWCQINGVLKGLNDIGNNDDIVFGLMKGEG